MEPITFIIAWMSGFFTVCLLCLYQPFMDIWVGKKLELGFSAVICFCIYYFIYEINQLLNTYKDAAGIWHEDRFRPLVTALSNLGMNLLLVQVWGIYGVILSTVLSMIFIGMPWLLYNLFTVLFYKEDLKPYLKQLMLYAAVTLISCVSAYVICVQVPLHGLSLFIVRAVICCIVPNVIYFFIYRKTVEFKDSLELANKMAKGRLPFIRRLVREND